MNIDLVHTQPLFRDAPDTLAVKYTNPETGVHIEIPYDDLVNTVVAIDSLLSADEEPEATEAQVEELQSEMPMPAGMRVMRSRIEADDV